MNSEIVEKQDRQYIFGPVPSRRLGRSLGVDLTPFKTCSYDCIYCQLGRTTHKTVQQKEWLPFKDIIDQLNNKLSLQPDYITLSGSGEPTLYSRCGELIREIKKLTDIPIAVLTNGSLLWKPQVRASLREANLVIPSLDAGSDFLFQYINRPHTDITFEKMLEGLIAFRREFQGNYWLEVFLLAGVSTTDKEMEHLKSAIDQINPDKIQINTVTRPPAEKYAEAVPEPELSKLACKLSENAEVIADYKAAHPDRKFTTRQADIVTLLKRRPCSIEDISHGLGLHPNEVVKSIDTLLANGTIILTPSPRGNYYSSLVR